MVLAAVEHPPLRRRAERAPPRRPGGPGPRRTPRPSRSITTPLARASRPASRSSPSDTSSIAVAPAAAAAGPAASGDTGRRYAADELRVRVRAPGLEQRQPGRRPPGDPGVRDDVARRARPTRSTGARPSRSPCAVTATTTSGPPDRSPPTTPTPSGAHSAAEAAGQVLDPRRGQVRRDHQRDDQARRPRAHRGDVGEVLHGGTPADVLAGRPRPPEVPVLDQHVGGHDEPAVGRGHDGGVVAGRHERVGARGQEREDAGEQLLLGQVGDERDRVGGGVAGHADTVEVRRPARVTVTGCPSRPCADACSAVASVGRRRRPRRVREHGPGPGRPARHGPRLRVRRAGDAGLARRRPPPARHHGAGHDGVGRPRGADRPALRRRAPGPDDRPLPDRRDAGRPEHRLGRRRGRRTATGRSPPTAASPRSSCTCRRRSRRSARRPSSTSSGRPSP